MDHKESTIFDNTTRNRTGLILMQKLSICISSRMFYLKNIFFYYLIQETCHFWIVGIPEYSSYDTEKVFSGKAKLETTNCLISLLVNYSVVAKEIIF